MIDADMLAAARGRLMEVHEAGPGKGSGAGAVEHMCAALGMDPRDFALFTVELAQAIVAEAKVVSPFYIAMHGVGEGFQMGLMCGRLEAAETLG